MNVSMPIFLDESNIFEQHLTIFKAGIIGAFLFGLLFVCFYYVRKRSSAKQRANTTTNSLQLQPREGTGIACFPTKTFNETVNQTPTNSSPQKITVLL